MFKRAEEFLEEFKKTYGNYVEFDILLKEMKLKLGFDEERTIKPYLKMMNEFLLIKEDENGRIWIK